MKYFDACSVQKIITFCWISSFGIFSNSERSIKHWTMRNPSLREQVSFVCAGYRFIDQSSRQVKSLIVPPAHLTYQGELRYCHVACLTAMYDSSRCGKLFLDEQLNGYCDDYAFWLQILKKSGDGCGNPKNLASYRIANSHSITDNKFKLILPHFRFHFNYCQLGFWKSVANTIVWGINGLCKFIFYSRKH